jgi:hypothetical protein
MVHGRNEWRADVKMVIDLKRLLISLASKQLLASQEGLCTMEFVSRVSESSPLCGTV